MTSLIGHNGKKDSFVCHVLLDFEIKFLTKYFSSSEGGAK